MKILKIKTERRKIGDIGERAAIKLLKKSGHKILEKNFVALDSEIDIIASDREHIIFVEVKTRRIENLSPMEPRPASAVTEEKARKIMRAAAYYKGYHPIDKKMRFDIIEVLLDGNKDDGVKEMRHLKGAFTKDNLSKGYGG